MGTEVQSGSVEHALAITKRGWAIFPLQGKIPFPGSHGFKDATADESEIRELWDKYQRPDGVGIRTGAASGIWVLDVDTIYGRNDDGEESLHELEAENEPYRTRSKLGLQLMGGTCISSTTRNRRSEQELCYRGSTSRVMVDTSWLRGRRIPRATSRMHGNSAPGKTKSPGLLCGCSIRSTSRTVQEWRAGTRLTGAIFTNS